jgi:hypothetical protein
MKIKKNGVTINLTEAEIKKISKIILKEQMGAKPFSSPKVVDLQYEFMNGPVTEFCKKWSGSIEGSADCEYHSPCYDILIAMRKMKKQDCNPIIPEYRKDGEPQ